MLKSLTRNERLRIADKIDQLAVNPDDLELDVKPLEGSELFRLRVGGWRVIFARFDTLKVIAIEKIGARGDVYK
jgi:mRNA interferase RelE/StbE